MRHQPTFHRLLEVAAVEGEVVITLREAPGVSAALSPEAALGSIDQIRTAALLAQEQRRGFADSTDDTETRDEWRKAPVSMLLWSIAQGGPDR